MDLFGSEEDEDVSKPRDLFENTSFEDEDDFAVGQKTLGLRIFHKTGVKHLPTNLFRTFPGLVAIEVKENSIMAVKNNHFMNLTNLRILNLEHNKIEYVASDAFIDLARLENLNLAFNRIQLLGKNTFSSLKELKTLNLYDNEIQFLHLKIFSSLVNLEQISISKNEIISLDDSIFENLVNLKNVYLIANKLERIPKTLFRNNSKLVTIRLDENKIKFIDASMFDHLPDLNNVDLRYNLCTKGDYYAKNFVAMRIELKQSCSGDISTHKALEKAVAEVYEKLHSSIENSEKQKVDVQRKLASQSDEIKTLKMQMEANFEALNNRVDAVNKTSNTFTVTFDG